MAELPEYKRTTEIREGGGVQDFGSAMRDVASASWGTFGRLGASVAQSASQQMAAKTGYEMGLNPQGNLTPPITDFDKTLAQSYHAQAYSILTLQANQMFYGIDNTLSQSPYLSEDMVKSAAMSMQQGVQGIVKNAPDAIKNQLETQLTGQVESNISNYRNKLNSQNIESDAKTTKAFLDQNNIVINNLTMSGNLKDAETAAQSSKDVIQIDAERTGEPAEITQAKLDAVDLSLKTAKARFNYGNARKAGYGAYYIDGVAKDKSLSDEEKGSILSSLFSYRNVLDQASQEKENILAAQMSNRIALNPNTISANDLLAYKAQVNPLRYAQTEHELIQAKKSENTQSVAVTELMANWGNPTSHADADPKVQTATFQRMVDKMQQPVANGGLGMSQENAEVSAQISAGAPVENFAKRVNDRLLSGNLNEIATGARQIHALYATESGKGLVGISDQAKAVADQFTALSNHMPADEAARQAIDTVQNQKPEVMREVDQQWSNMVKNKIGTGYGRYSNEVQFALGEMKINPNDFGNSSLTTLYGVNILSQLKSNFRLVKGDYQGALRLTKAEVALNYDYSRVNGAKVMTEHPLEKVLGYKSSDVVPYIHEDIKRTLTPKFQQSKADFDAGKSEEYWTAGDVSHDRSGLFNYPPLQVTRHTRDGKSETYDVVVQGNDVGTWDIAFNTNSGIRNSFLVAPQFGYMTYVPNKKAIDSQYQEINRIGMTLPATSSIMQSYFLPQSASRKEPEPSLIKMASEAGVKELSKEQTPFFAKVKGDLNEKK